MPVFKNGYIYGMHFNIVKQIKTILNIQSFTSFATQNPLWVFVEATRLRNFLETVRNVVSPSENG